MNAINWKKLLLPNIPYLLFVYLFDKVGQAVRLAPGADLSGKVLSLGEGFSMAFATPLPSLAPMDLLIGIFGAVLIRLIVYVKGKNAKKYRKGVEYGSARWGNAEDIKPYTDPVFQNNVLLTQTERLTMNSRPKQPKYARNKNILVIGGSGSGKTRFFVKPNLMQMHSSYVVTDPKGTVLVECGKLLQRGGYRIKVLNTINFKKSIPELLLLVMETSLVSLCMKIMSVLITVILYGRMIEIYAYCSVSPIPFATMTNREWGQIGNNYLKGLFALGFQGFLIMICVGIYAVLVGEMVLADNLHSAIFSLAAYTVILCFSLFKSGALAKSIFNAH